MEYQLTIATLENRPIRHELWVYDDVVYNGAVQIGSKQIVKKFNVNSSSIEDITQCISLEEWRNGKAVVAGVRDFQAGDIEEITMTLNDQIIKTGEIVLFLSNNKSIKFSSNEYTGTVPNITVNQTTIDDINIQSKGSIAIQSVSDGVLTLWR